MCVTGHILPTSSGGLGHLGFICPDPSLCSFTETLGPALGRKRTSPSDRGPLCFLCGQSASPSHTVEGLRVLSHQLCPGGGTMGSPWQGVLLSLLQGGPRPPPGVREGRSRHFTC